MNLPHDLIEYVYEFITPKPCRNPYIILDREMLNRYTHRTQSCRIQYFYGLEWCETHKFVRPVQHHWNGGPGCIIS